MNFSTRLKKLLDVGNLKMKDLGNYLNYDLSYISKWVNGKCLPSNKYAEDTFEKMAKFFALKLYLTDVESEIKEMTGRDIPLDTIEENEIRNLEVTNMYRNLFLLTLSIMVLVLIRSEILT